jgi:uncharacterized Zn-binding protein involved in type VI secretion
VPHVGGPIVMGSPNVLIGNLPAARVGDMAVCVGPPDKVSSGSSGVLINGKPAARLGDSTAHGGKIVVGYPTVLIGGGGGGGSGGGGGTDTSVKSTVIAGSAVGVAATIPVSSPVAGNSVPSIASNLGSGVENYIKNSPTLSSSLTTLEKQGWEIKFGPSDKGSFCDKENKVIQIAESEKDNSKEITTTLAHESGHALYQADPYVPPDGLTKEEYVSKNVDSGLKDEGEATLQNIKISREIKKNTGDDIPVAGSQTQEYEKIYDAYEKDGDREAARKKIGDIFADKERPSGDPNLTYREYYSKPYADYYDQYGGN